MKLDKRGKRILVGSLLAASIVVFLFLITFHFSRLRCELVKLEPQLLRNAQRHSFDKDKPLRSHDKTMLMKIAAYLEYNTGSSSSSSNNNKPTIRSSSSATTRDLARDPAPATALAAGSGANSSNHLQQFIVANLSHNAAPQPGPQSPLPNQQVPSSPTTASHLLQAGEAPSGDAERPERRFLPLGLEEIETRRQAEGRFRYTLTFNCSTLNMLFVRHRDRIHVESMDLELRPSVQGKKSCELELPSGGVLAVPTQEGYGHYHCDRGLHYKCYHPASGPDSDRSLRQPLVELHITSIEFETIGRPTNSSQELEVKKKEFRTTRSEFQCPSGR